MSKLRDVPGDAFVAAILRGYNTEATEGHDVTCSQIWNQVVNECLRQPHGFVRMFAWDTRKASQNRIGTIAEVIAAGHVPGLQVDERLRVTRKREIY